MLTYFTKKEDDLIKVFFNGSFDTVTGEVLGRLRDEIDPFKRCSFNFRDIQYINSLGLRAWLSFLKHIQKERDITFEECAPIVVNQINFIEDFRGIGKIVSFYGFFSCTKCDHESSYLFDTTKGYKKIIEEVSQISCEKCKSGMELEEDEDAYFRFLTEND